MDTPPVLVLVTGLPGTGKSSVADVVASELNAAVLAHDWAMSALRPYPELRARAWKDGALRTSSRGLVNPDFAGAVATQGPTFGGTGWGSPPTGDRTVSRVGSRGSCSIRPDRNSLFRRCGASVSARRAAATYPQLVRADVGGGSTVRIILDDARRLRSGARCGGSMGQQCGQGGRSARQAWAVNASAPIGVAVSQYRRHLNHRVGDLDSSSRASDDFFHTASRSHLSEVK